MKNTHLRYFVLSQRSCSLIMAVESTCQAVLQLAVWHHSWWNWVAVFCYEIKWKATDYKIKLILEKRKWETCNIDRSCFATKLFIWGHYRAIYFHKKWTPDTGVLKSYIILIIFLGHCKYSVWVYIHTSVYYIIYTRIESFSKD